MSDLDEAAVKKLKVAELRSELQSRGLDSKGNKPVLVERLLEAISKVAEENGEEAMEETTEEPQEEVAEAKEETPVQESQLDGDSKVPEIEGDVTQTSETVPAAEPAEVVPPPIEEKPSEKPEETVQAPEPTPQEEKAAAEKQEDETKTDEPMETSQEIPSTSQTTEGW